MKPLPELMVTHYVVLQALTGRAICSGCAMVYNPVTNTSDVLEMDLSDVWTSSAARRSVLWGASLFLLTLPFIVEDVLLTVRLSFRL